MSVTIAITVFINLLIAAALVQALYPIQLDMVYTSTFKNTGGEPELIYVLHNSRTIHFSTYAQQYKPSALVFPLSLQL